LANEELVVTPRFFQLFFELMKQDAWVLGEIRRDDIQPADNWLFSRPPMIPMDSAFRTTTGKPFKTLVKRGQPVDYTQAGFAGVPIGSWKTVQALNGFEGFTAFPVEIENYTQKEPWYILHFWDEVDCFDEARSQFKVIQPDDPARPDLAGNYKSVSKTLIRPELAQGKDIFRIARLTGTIVVSEEVKRRFEDVGVTGAVFQDVTGDQKTVA